MSVSSQRTDFSPKAVYQAQRVLVSDKIMNEVFNLLVELYVPGEDAEIPFLDKVENLEKAFEEHGWDVKYDEKRFVYIFRPKRVPGKVMPSAVSSDLTEIKFGNHLFDYK
jgi:hypothetical protein